MSSLLSGSRKRSLSSSLFFSRDALSDQQRNGIIPLKVESFPAGRDRLSLPPPSPSTLRIENDVYKNVSAALFPLGPDERKEHPRYLILRPHKLICKAARSICSAATVERGRKREMESFVDPSSYRWTATAAAEGGNSKRKQKYKSAGAKILTEVSRGFLF